ncbi:uncharacterized protein LOC141719205 [Apium graveolens]|uniref:uncharacterized protein LOC141719205 n=1 Tax=Apium graveolens TaxID=4045 RepID=UPI003D7B0E1F
MENNGAANTERALVVWNNRKTIEISSLYIDFTMYGPFPTKLSSEAKALNQSESSPKSSEMMDVEAAHALIEMSKGYSKNPETAAETLPPEEPKYVSLRDLLGKKENSRKKRKT